MITIPFNKPSMAGSESEYMAKCVENFHLSGDGAFTQECQRFLVEQLGIKKALLTTNCTHALEMTAILLDLQKGDEVILPSFTFVSTANAYVLRGAVPIFADIRSDTLNIDETRLESLITSRTKAIIVVHYAGVACEMDEIMRIGNKYGIPIIEDNAHGLFGKYKGRSLGSIGALATLSFHETKNFTCGEGGALLINDEHYSDRAEIIREKGTNRSLFFRGQVDKYSWVDMGSSYLPSDLLAAFLYAQLEKHQAIQLHRKNLWTRYNTQLFSWATEHSIRLPFVPGGVDQAYHMFYLLLPSLEVRSDLIAFLKSKGILSVFHYLPLHLSRMGRLFGGKESDCPVTEDVSDRLLRLPFYNSLSDDEQATVIKTLKLWTK